MEYLKGISLKDYRRKQTISKEEIQNIALQICQVLRYLHEMETPLLYLDLKPENLLVCSDGIKIVDFGAALFKEEWKQYNICMGTRGYAAPELFEHKELDERSDIYSFGMLLFFLFTGEVPRREQKRIQNIDRLNYIEKGWKDVINQCLKYRPAMRFSSVVKLEKRILFLMKHSLTDRKEKTSILRVSGAASHSGVTYFCFMLAISFAAQGKRVAYREIKEQGVVESLLLWKGAKKISKGVICQGVRLLRGEEEKEEQESFDLEIQDYGFIEQEAAKQLFQLDKVILISSMKCWEIENLKEILAKFQKPPLLCMNFVSGKEFFYLARQYQKNICFRIPYQPEISKGFLGQERFLQRIWEEAVLCLEEEHCNKREN